MRKERLHLYVPLLNETKGAASAGTDHFRIPALWALEALPRLEQMEPQQNRNKYIMDPNLQLVI